MAEKIYLLGGGRDKEFYINFGKKVLEESSNKNLFIIDWAKDNEGNRENLKSHFENVGYDNIVFVTELNSFEDIKNNLDKSGVLFIAGGITKLLYNQVIKNRVDKLIKSFDGIIIGNSAGAYLCCNGYFDRGSNLIVFDSLGLVEIILKVHYSEESDSLLLELSNEKDIYASSEGSYILSEDGNLSFVGENYLFKDGEKIKVD